ncbi:TPA: barstar family protein [Citrobacter youngae]|uniref:Ribonuclease inhibitor n=1 Tax=Citrobacter youngae TaxID=133448 RepID=A0A9Q7ZQ03_9ENTR|nr:MULTISPECIES: barstar family protein [Citrobacter]MBJ8740233.1 barstar family protein [Citrobacter sp. FDAARGOS_156]MBJ8882868.1 barstar family protein [Citrobacter sp. FDAARGOS_156]MBJ9559988.1 barstar family protein [Citrobacter sp. FDAARGOS_156]MDM2730370.1 barstar family protein [Citrobacter sp. Cy070]SUX80459.1 Ribonuclease inhibitor [Citrobacter youngae]
MNEIILDGKKIQNESDFHSVMSDLLDFGPYYGRNLDALWDRLSTDIERPVKIIWLHSELSRQNLGESFDRIIQIFERTRQQDITFKWDERFDYILK